MRGVKPKEGGLGALVDEHQCETAHLHILQGCHAHVVREPNDFSNLWGRVHEFISNSPNLSVCGGWGLRYQHLGPHEHK